MKGVREGAGDLTHLNLAASRAGGNDGIDRKTASYFGPAARPDLQTESRAAEGGRRPHSCRSMMRQDSRASRRQVSGKQIGQGFAGGLDRMAARTAIAAADYGFSIPSEVARQARSRRRERAVASYGLVGSGTRAVPIPSRPVASLRT